MTLLIVSSTLALVSATAFACPQGTQLKGGTGPYHKGGKCVMVAKKAQKAKKTQKAKESAHTTHVQH